MNIFLNTIHKILCVQNRTMLKCLWVTPVSEAHRISIFKKYYHTTLDTFSEYSQSRNLQKNLDPWTLHIFRKSRDFLLNSEGYDSTIETFHAYKYYKPKFIRNEICTDFSHLSHRRALEVFKNCSVDALQRNKHISDGKYEEIISLLTRNCKLYKDYELLELLKNLEMWSDIGRKQSPHNSIRKLLELIDEQFNKRSQYWAVDKTLKYCDTICQIFNFHSNFVESSLRRLTIDPSILSYKNIVQIMYYLFLYNIPKSQIEHMEPYIEDNFDKFTIEELGIICMGFFRSQVHITSDTLLCKLMQKVIDNVDTISIQGMGQIFKEIRYSFITKPHCVEKCMELMEVLVPRVTDMNQSTVTHLSHLAADSHICNPRLLSAIVERFTANLRNMRLKDIERMLFFMTTFSIPSSHPLYNLVIEELGSSHRTEEKRKFPRALGFTLRFLALVNIYPLHLISTVMSSTHIKLAYGSNPYDLGVEYFILDQSIEIDVPEYRGPRLENDTCNILYQKNDSPDEHNFASNFKKQVIQKLNNIFHKKYDACLERILPHFTQSDIILCLDKDNNPIPAKPILENIKSHIKRVPEEFKDRTWIAIICTTECLLIRGTNEFTGNLLAKIRHLEKVGFVPIVIPHVEWKALYSDFQKCKYLEKNISEVTKLQKYEKPVQKTHAFR